MPLPDSNKKSEQKSNAYYLRHYGGLTFQLFAVAAVGLWLGLKTDSWFQLKFPLFAAVFPVLGITGVLIRIFKDTSGKHEK